MTTLDQRRLLADALSVTWTPALEAETKARIDQEVTARRRRRKQALKATAILLTVCAGGVVFAFARSAGPPRSESGHGGPSRGRAAPPPAPAPPATTPATADAPAAGPVADQPADPERSGHDRALARRLVAKAAPPPTQAPLGDPVEARFAAADRARLAGRPRDAVRPLTEIQDRYPADPRAAVAAFQLGRILADELGDPAAAARAFARVQALAPDGPLAADARARADEARRAARTTPSIR